MVLQLLVSGIYQVVQHSWVAAAVTVKYVLLVHAARLAYENRLELENFLDAVEQYSRETVTGIVVLGFLLALLGLEATPLVEPVSEIVALAYFGFLFWRY